MERKAAVEPSSSGTRAFPLAAPRHRIAPSLLSADFARLHDDVALIEQAGAEVLHLDVMDGHFVPNISFGIPVIQSIRKCSKLFFDAHLMIEEPKRYAEAFVNAGCDHITFHVEVSDDPRKIVDHIHALGVSAGVSINPTTPVDALQDVLDAVDMVLVMSVWPGFSGQRFIEDVLPKVSELRRRLGPHQRLEIDGGIDVETIGRAASAGADTFVAGNAVFGQADPASAYRRLCKAAAKTTA